ncbi:HAD hydrolase family protein [Sphaerotilus montanus]|jgi:3-deoxy-D-manno-octulosonate 8-phosphate phosphatase (KDO 8-P phosphatase)|uniref:3-deoxy-D-manno-octulosonate 8-phosphate phosphatase KdsC n=1 Tax=Sphaerotilus montanus TaxID=522889 RepID=A0A7Y9QYZ0_9BURK|nr:HAD hydrolase family protein [Sphaerotilus montanus]NYG32150.1 3-deoxy-D-manno-octulosonate 8-phosphate phosphatase (KDO 8-P phosphatase) [Sphaerotilus montanus]NZD57624.1 HAD hydrolase family protein [Sphaerotilus montanus]
MPIPTPVWPRPVTPTLQFPPALLLRAQPVRAAVFDVDGCLTDGRIYIGESGETVKAFSTLDGHGIKLLARAGITPVVITGRDTPAVRRRCADLGIVHALYGIHDKLAAAEQVLQTLGLDWHALAVIGDDWPDLPLMVRCALACAPAQAHAEVQAAAHHVTAMPGGQGAAREFCDVLLMAAGRYGELLAGHLTTLDGAAR